MKMDIITLDQNTDEWLVWRSLGIGGSDAPAIMGVSPWETPLSLWQRRLGKVPPKEYSDAMKRGHELEPVARVLLERATGLLFEPLCGVNKKVKWLRASFDGVSMCRTWLAEIKCPGVEDHQKAKDGLVPAKYWPQCQHQMLVAGINQLYYVSYNPEDVDQPLAIVEVFADRAYQKTLVVEEERWWKCFTEQRMPVAHDDLVKALAWRKVKLLHDQYKSMMEEAQNELLLGIGFDAEKPAIMKKDLGFVKVSTYEVDGGVQWDELCQSLGIDDVVKDSFRAPKSVRVRVSKGTQVRAKATEKDFFG